MLQAEAEKASKKQETAVSSHIFVKQILCGIDSAIVTEEQTCPAKFVQAEGKEAFVFVFRPGQ